MLSEKFFCYRKFSLKRSFIIESFPYNKFIIFLFSILTIYFENCICKRFVIDNFLYLKNLLLGKIFYYRKFSLKRRFIIESFPYNKFIIFLFSILTICSKNCICKRFVIDNFLYLKNLLVEKFFEKFYNQKFSFKKKIYYRKFSI